MQALKITSAGQVSLPAKIRRRWNTDRVMLIDEGDRVVLRPVPDDPIASLVGMFKHLSGPTTDEMRAQDREEEAEIEDRKYRR